MYIYTEFVEYPHAAQLLRRTVSSTQSVGLPVFVSSRAPMMWMKQLAVPDSMIVLQSALLRDREVIGVLTHPARSWLGNGVQYSSIA